MTLLLSATGTIRPYSDFPSVPITVNKEHAVLVLPQTTQANQPFLFPMWIDSPYDHSSLSDHSIEKKGSLQLSRIA